LHKSRFHFVIGLTASLITAAAALAAPVPWNQAIAHYNAGKYSQALAEFKQYAIAYPTNAQSHYYLGLCYQSMGNRTEARTEFALTTKYGTDPIKTYAQTALNSLEVGSSSRSVATGSSAPAWPAASSSQGVAGILEFYTDT